MLSGLSLGPRSEKTVKMLSRPALACGITEEIEKRQLDRRDLHLARIRLAVFDAGGYCRHVFSEVEGDFRAAGLHVPHLAVRDDLELHDCLMRRPVQFGRLQQANIVGPVLVAHQIVDEGGRRRTSEIQMLGRNDDVEAVAQIEKPVALLQFLGCVEERPSIDAKSRLSLFPRKHQATSGKASHKIGAEARSRGCRLIFHYPL